MSTPSTSRTDSPSADALRRLVTHPVAWIALWIVSRGWMLRQWTMHQQYIVNDVKYYFAQLNQSGGYPVTLREYPMPVVWLLDLMRWPADTNVNVYVIVFALLMAILDLGFAVWLWTEGSRTAAIYWSAFTFAMGPLIWFRYDLLAGVVVGAAVLLVARRPRLSGSLLALGAGIKLWPALLLAGFVGHEPQSRRRTIHFWATGLGLAFLSLLTAGFTRLFSPLGWQSERGLQIESVWATGPMVLRSLGGPEQTAGADARWQVQMSPFNAYEITGPGIEGLLNLASIAMGLGVLFAILTGWLFWRRPMEPATRALACLALVLVMISANKALSPQYMAWLGAVSAAWLALTPAGRDRNRALVVCGICLVLSAATQTIYPRRYGELLSADPSNTWVTWTLLLRNVGLASLTLLTIWWTLSALLSHRFAQATGGTTNINPR
ncbi:glycosyltransferase 87 family protein [Luteococcus sp. Sow4_B9]|uniref:glycosyltransferase 87 family protein n=1 Tax=Luteococcus sp. Sow4_B9 TaxID=3438792 RepID=UPI003F94EA56